MDRKFRTWKLALDRFWRDPAPDYREIARLVTEMALSDEITLRQAATQAMPSLRNAVVMKSDRTAGEIVRRRLGLIHDALHALTAPQFGKRGIAPKVPTPEERYRQMLGLPPGRRLDPAEIHQAYKRAAKSVHPDHGGDGHAFRQLAEARDALMKQH
jgi:hypothetical protein